MWASILTPPHSDPNITKAYAINATWFDHVRFSDESDPENFRGRVFISGDLLQVLVVASLVALAIHAMGERGKPVLQVIGVGSQVFFGIMHIIVKLAPIGIFGARWLLPSGAMAFVL